MNRILTLLLLASALTTSVRAQNTQVADSGVPIEHLTFGRNETDRCLKCHGMVNFAYKLPVKDGDRLRNFTVLADTFKASVHAAVTCTQCHQDILEYPHKFSGGRPRVLCGADCHAVDKQGALYDHAKTFSEYRTSVHGKGLTDSTSGSPRCESCHGAGNPHAIHKAKGSLTKSERMNLCITCHDDRSLMLSKHVDPDAVSSYRQSFHYKAIRFGQTETAVCQDCHRVHAILPADSVASSISPANIASTCGQQSCHTGVAMNFAMSGANHLRMRIEKEPILFIEEKLFIVLTLGTMAMLVVGILLDIQKKYGWLRLGGASARSIGRRLRSLRGAGQRALVLGKRILID